MIRSMTAFGSARTQTAQGSISLELRAVNSRFLDLSFRIPDDLRMVEGPIREKLSEAITRGKVDVRVNYTRESNRSRPTIDLEYVSVLAQQLESARSIIPDVPAPRLGELIEASNGLENAGFDPEVWTAMCLEATSQALSDFQSAREREGARLAQGMLDCADEALQIVARVEQDLPSILGEHQQKLANKIHEALCAASPEGFTQISGAELTARIAQETSLFSLRIDVAEELSRLRSHMAELKHLLTSGPAGSPSQTDLAKKARKNSSGTGKRLDFLFQEMNREANTLGSKASGLSITRAAIDLKLLIEQMREQAQNIE